MARAWPGTSFEEGVRPSHRQRLLAEAHAQGWGRDGSSRPLPRGTASRVTCAAEREVGRPGAMQTEAQALYATIQLQKGIRII